MNCPDCGTLMLRQVQPGHGVAGDDEPDEVVYRCPVCYPEPQGGDEHMAISEDTARKLRRTAALQVRYHAERDDLIRQAHAEGAGVREIARLVGMTHPGVLAILARDRDTERGLVSMGAAPPASSSQLSGAPVDYDG